MPGKGRGKIRAATEEIRTVFKLGPSLVMAVPSRYLRTHNLKAGDLVRVFYSDQTDTLYIMPITKTETKLEGLEKIRARLEQNLKLRVVKTPQAKDRGLEGVNTSPGGGDGQNG
jgi:antitoxin component of MazEF toxin-antitoxin module